MSYVDRGIRIAKEEARESDCPTYRVGAVLMRRNQRISSGRSVFKKSHTKSRTRYNGIHAEFDCLHKLTLDKCRGCVLFVARITNGGKVSMARPCEICLNLLREYDIRVFYYTDHDGNVVRERL